VKRFSSCQTCCLCGFMARSVNPAPSPSSKGWSQVQPHGGHLHSRTLHAGVESDARRCGASIGNPSRRPHRRPEEPKMRVNLRYRSHPLKTQKEFT
jgi:hypothetical protein